VAPIDAAAAAGLEAARAAAARAAAELEREDRARRRLASLALLAVLGLGGLWWVTRRRHEPDRAALAAARARAAVPWATLRACLFGARPLGPDETAGERLRDVELAVRGPGRAALGAAPERPDPNWPARCIEPADALLAALEPVRAELREIEVLAGAVRSARHGMRRDVPMGVDVMVLAARQARIPDAEPDPRIAPAPEVRSPLRARALRHAFVIPHASHTPGQGASGAAGGARVIAALRGTSGDGGARAEGASGILPRSTGGAVLLLRGARPAVCELDDAEAHCAPVPEGIDAATLALVPPGAYRPSPWLVNARREEGGAELLDVRAGFAPVVESSAGAVVLRDGVALVTARTPTAVTVRLLSLPAARPSEAAASGAREVTLPSRRPAFPEPTLLGGLLFAGRFEPGRGARPRPAPEAAASGHTVVDALWLAESAAQPAGARFVFPLDAFPSEQHACATPEVRAVALVHAGAPTEPSDVTIVFGAPDGRSLGVVPARTTGAGFVFTCDGRRASLVGRVPRGASAQQGFDLVRLDCTPEGCAAPETVTLERVWDLPDALAVGDDLVVVYSMGPSGGLLLRRGRGATLPRAPALVLVDDFDFGGVRVDARAVVADGDDVLVALESAAGVGLLRVRADGQVVSITPTAPR
jgi:hypothetical protein